ncbi:MAG: hypothetical protein UZ17_ACD001002667 [Acidobacteria bacterium OLB17]|nr:MAG: hypothetical protein UZ17_ACD001002667 [Acidobacteria bacterium OLB17]
MTGKQRQEITVIRNRELVDRDSTIIGSDQALKLKKDNATKSTEAKANQGLRLWSKEPELIYSSGKGPMRRFTQSVEFRRNLT